MGRTTDSVVVVLEEGGYGYIIYPVEYVKGDKRHSGPVVAVAFALQCREPKRKGIPPYQLNTCIRTAVS